MDALECICHFFTVSGPEKQTQTAGTKFKRFITIIDGE